MRAFPHSLDLQFDSSVHAECAALRKVECASSAAGATPNPELVGFGGVLPPGLSEALSTALSQMSLYFLNCA